MLEWAIVERSLPGALSDVPVQQKTPKVHSAKCLPLLQIHIASSLSDGLPPLPHGAGQLSRAAEQQIAEIWQATTPRTMEITSDQRTATSWTRHPRSRSVTSTRQRSEAPRTPGGRSSDCDETDRSKRGHLSRHCAGSPPRGRYEPSNKIEVHLFLSNRPTAGCATQAKESNRPVARKGSPGAARAPRSGRRC